MVQKILPEWSGNDLVYIDPVAAIEKVGYALLPENYTEAEGEVLQRVYSRIPSQDGEVAAQRTDFADPAAAAKRVKQVGQELGADLVGITHVDQHHVYKDEDVPHRFAIVAAFAMDFAEIAKAPTAATNLEVLRTYERAGQLAIALAETIRSLGYPARAHTLAREQLVMLPHAYAAGLGELGKHGSLINRDLGCSFRVAVVTTDLPLSEDVPRLEGIDDVCTKCQMCVRYCPGDAISDDKQDVRGVMKWVVELEKCAPYWGTYSACAICLEVCPWNAKAFDGRYKETFVNTIKGIDLPQWRAELKAGLQEQWTKVSRPAPPKE